MPDDPKRAGKAIAKPGSRHTISLWRISNYGDLSGRGGLATAARWHCAGHPVVYLADSPSTALLETLVHLELDEGDYPDPRRLLEVAVPEECRIVRLPLPKDDSWKDKIEVTQRLGTEWLTSRASPLALVPSVIVAEASNYLLNPAHPDAERIRIVSDRLQTFDRRLIRFGGR